MMTMHSAWGAAIGALLGSIIAPTITSFFSEKGKSIATKQDIGEITNKVEEVKDAYARALETYKNEVKQNYDTILPRIQLAIDLDKHLIDQINELKESLFSFAQLQKHDVANDLLDQLALLSRFIVKYKVRYASLPGAIQIVKAQNDLAEMKKLPNVDLNHIEAVFIDVTESIELLLASILPAFSRA